MRDPVRVLLVVLEVCWRRLSTHPARTDRPRLTLDGAPIANEPGVHPAAGDHRNADLPTDKYELN